MTDALAFSIAAKNGLQAMKGLGHLGAAYLLLLSNFIFKYYYIFSTHTSRYVHSFIHLSI
jgi:hypothetical protein